MIPATAVITPAAFAANDNQPPESKGDLWRRIIDGMKPICQSFAVYCAQEQLRGTDPIWFCDTLIDIWTREQEIEDWLAEGWS